MSRIPYAVCPFCASQMDHHSFNGQHVNGQWFETKRFQCGAEYRWVPNFERMVTPSYCRSTPEGVEQRERAQLLDELAGYSIYDTLKKWPTDLLVKLKRFHEDCVTTIMEREAVEERRKMEARRWSGFKKFSEANP